MVRSVEEFIQLIREDSDLALALTNKSSVMYVLETKMNLVQFAEIAALHERLAMELADNFRIQRYVTERASVDQLLAQAKGRATLIFVEKNIFNLIKIAENITIAQLIQLAKAHGGMTQTLVKYGDHPESKSDYKIAGWYFKYRDEYTNIQKMIAEKATINELFEIIKADSGTAQALAESEDILQMFTEKAGVDQFIELIKIDKATARIFAGSDVVQKMLLGKMSVDQFFEIGRMDGDTAWELIRNKDIRKKIAESRKGKDLIAEYENTNVEKFIGITKTHGGKSLALAAEEKVQKMFAEQATLNDFFEIAKLHPATARVLAENVVLLKKIAREMTVDQFIELANTDATTTRELAKDFHIQSEMIEPKITTDQLIVLEKTDSRTVGLLDVVNHSFRYAVIDRMLEENNVEQFIELSKGEFIAKRIARNYSIQHMLAEKMTVAEFIAIAKSADRVSEELAESDIIQKKLTKEMTADEFIELAKVSKFTSRRLGDNSDIRGIFKNEKLIEKFIELTKVNDIIAKDFLRESDSIKQNIENEITVDQFIKLSIVNDYIPGELLENVNMKKRLAKQMTVEKFIELANADEDIALELAKDSSSLKLFYDPAEMIKLMERSPSFAKKLIKSNESINEILIINDIPETHPELFGFLDQSSTTTKEDVQKAKKALAKSYGLKDSEEYHAIILFVVGNSVLNKLTDFKKEFGSPNLSAGACIEIGRLFIDRLNGIDVTPSEGLCGTFALLCKRDFLSRLTFGAECKPKQLFFSKGVLASSKSSYKELKEKYQNFFSDFFSEINLNQSTNLLSRLADDFPIAACLYDALYTLDNERYADKPRDLSDITTINLSNFPLMDSIRELNYQNEHFPGLLEDVSQQESDPNKSGPSK